MIIKQVSFRRVFNLGNYETMTVELVADLNDGENPKEALNGLVKEAFDWKKEKEAIA